MKKLICFFLVLSYHNLSQASIYYVNLNATGSNDGSSWENAFTFLPDALTAATVGDEVWVAQGTYFPSQVNNESDEFLMSAGVAIYGGFNGTETELTQRDWVTNTTRLSGEIGDATAADNSTWVVLASNAGSNCRLDGFTILGGHNWETYDYGAGLKIINSSPTIANCIFTANASDYGGAAIGIDGGLLTLDKCQFIDNTSDFGSCLWIQEGTVYINDCVFKENTSVVSGACIYADNGLARIDRCVFTNNYSQSQCSVMNFGDNGKMMMYNSLIAGNYAVNGRTIAMSTLDNSQNHEIINCTIANNSSQVDYFSVIVTANTKIANSIVWGNDAGSTGSQIINLTTQVYNSYVQNGLTYNGNPVPGAINTNPQLINPGPTSAAPFDAADYNYRLPLLSPAVNAGSNANAANAGSFDLLMNDRIQGGTVDAGAYEFNSCNLEIAIVPNGPTSFCPGENVVLTASGAESFEWQNNGSTSESITATSSGIYEVIGITGDSCIGSAQITVTALNASVNITGNDVFCDDFFTTLTANGTNNSSYSWSDGQSGNTALVNTPGWIVVTAVANNGCVSQDSILISIGSNPNPTIFQSGTNLTTGGYSTFQWYFNNDGIPGAENQTYTPTENGTYIVQVTNADGCVGTSQPFEVTWVNLEEVSKSGIGFYPNPSKGMLYLTGTKLPEEISIFSTQGQKVYSLKNLYEQQLELNDLQTGMYIIQMKIGNDVIQKELIIMN